MYKFAHIRNYLLFPIILFLTLFLFYGCTKIDTHIGDNVNSNDISVITNKFFETSVNTNPITLTIINEIKKRNTKNEFVTAFAKNNGYPVWDKAIIKTRRRESNITSFANSVPTNDSFALIPFVLADSNFVNGYIFC